MSPLTEPTRIVLRNGWQPMDPDAAAYITAVETADGQALEEQVKIAIDNFVLGCKADGIWDAIKASCILAGARTLNGALVPLAGTAPTNYNFVSADYNRKTGLVGDGSTKYLDSNRNNNADPQNSKHIAAHITVASIDTGSRIGNIINSTENIPAARTNLADNFIGGFRASRVNNETLGAVSSFLAATGFTGSSRDNSANFILRTNGVNETINNASEPPANVNIGIYGNTEGPLINLANARLAFYSIGESLDLALLDARVTDLINKFAEVIP